MSSIPYTTIEQVNNANISATVSLPSGAKVTSVSANTGNVSWSQSGLQVSLNCNSGAWERRTPYSYTYDCSASPSSKTASAGESGTRANYQRWTSSGWAFDHSTGDAPSSYSYNDGSYSGTLPRTSVSYGTPTYYYPGPSNPTIGQIWHNSDTAWSASFSGTVNAIPKTCNGTGYDYYYKYVLTIFYNIGRFSRFYNISHYGRGERGTWTP